jgi:hypothetical protein
MTILVPFNAEDVCIDGEGAGQEPVSHDRIWWHLSMREFFRGNLATLWAISLSDRTMGSTPQGVGIIQSITLQSSISFRYKPHLYSTRIILSWSNLRGH